jgi:hypothetical protein
VFSQSGVRGESDPIAAIAAPHWLGLIGRRFPHIVVGAGVAGIGGITHPTPHCLKYTGQRKKRGQDTRLVGEIGERHARLMMRKKWRRRRDARTGSIIERTICATTIIEGCVGKTLSCE